MTSSATKPADPLPLSDTVIRRTWTTPRRLAALGVVTVLLVLGLGLLLAASAGAVRNGFDVIGQEAAPQVRSTSDLYFALSDLDAQAANVLLVGTGPALATQRTAALNTYERRRSQADHDVAQVSGTSQLLDQLGRYESLAAQAFLVNQQGHDPLGRPSPAALALYRQATDTMRDALADVRQLTGHESALLDSTYADRRGATTAARTWVVVLGGSAVAALVATQVSLRRRLRRRTNPALLLATALTLATAATGIGVLGVAANELTVAKSDAFDSIIALSQARSISYDANADESRYLVDPQRAARYQRAFLAKSQSLLTVYGDDLPVYEGALDVTLRNYLVGHEDDFAGYFGTEARNVTFPGEQAAVADTLTAYQAYQHDDGHLRALADGGDLTGAVAFDIGTAPGESDHDFTAYDDALVALIQVNQNAFTTAVHNGQSVVAAWRVVLPGIGTLLVLGLVWLGVWPRIAEYR